MDFTFFSSNEEEMFFELVEIKAHATGKAIKESLLLVFNKTLILINDESKLDNLLSLEFVLHK